MDPGGNQAVSRRAPDVALDTPVRYLKGIGPERSKLLEKLGLECLEEVLYFFPRRYENRAPVKLVGRLDAAGEKECAIGRVTAKNVTRTKTGLTAFRLSLSDGRTTLYASWYHMPYLSKVFEPGAAVAVYGKAERHGSRLEMIHPDYEIIEKGKAAVHVGRIVPVYPLTEDLGQKGLRQFVFRMTREYAALVRDPLPEPLRRRMGLPDLAKALKEIHFPPDEKSRAEAYRRLVFDEFFLMQLAVQMRREALSAGGRGLAHAGGEARVENFLRSLPFELTAGQRRAIADLVADMKKNRPMNRLIQGDVGSGKTVVAAAGLVFTASSGFQGALMAPTEVLAQQHIFTLAPLLEPFGVRCGYFAQSAAPDARRAALEKLASGEIHVAIGTHALIQKDVRFKRLGLAVIDEQHKFGVFQRATLFEKGGGGRLGDQAPHFLLMTATPIPRTLALTLYGDMDLSIIAERPKGRKEVNTLWVGSSKRAEIYAQVERELAKGRQAYVVCPMIDGGAATAKSVLTAHRELSSLFEHRRVGLLHGRMKAAEKAETMRCFKSGEIELLVSTVVIEVGVDVPNATILVLENAERFGLAQLHQLRGRVGRGADESWCVLFSDAVDPETAERLETFAATSSGFEIAEKDLELRGAGDLMGEKQHGLPALRIGDLARDVQILETAQREAVALVSRDARLAAHEHRALRVALRARFGSVERMAALQ